MKAIVFLVVLLSIVFGIAAQSETTGEVSTTDVVGTTTGALTGTTGDVIVQQQVTLRIEGNVSSFNEVSFTEDLSTLLGINASRIQILNITEGSVIIQFVILPSSDPAAPTPSSVVSDLSVKVQNVTLMQTFGITVLNYTVVNVAASTTGAAVTTGGQGSSTTGVQGSSTTGVQSGSTTGVQQVSTTGVQGSTTGAAEGRTIASGSSNGPSSGAIAGAVIGSILGFMVLVSIAAIVYRRSSQRDNTRHLEAGIELVAPNKKSEESSDEESEEEDDDEDDESEEDEKKEEPKKEQPKKEEAKKDAKKEESSEEESSESESDSE